MGATARSGGGSRGSGVGLRAGAIEIAYTVLVYIGSIYIVIASSAFWRSGDLLCSPYDVHDSQLFCLLRFAINGCSNGGRGGLMSRLR